jgi:flagellar FliL protein
LVSPVYSKEKEGGQALFVLDPFVLNIGSLGSNRFLKLSLSVDLSGAAAIAKAKAKTAAIRDALIILITAKTADDLMYAEGRDKLKNEIISALNRIMGEGSVNAVYFTDFVMQ